MTQRDTTSTIRAALGKMAAGNLSESATGLLAAMGYRSDRTLDGQTGNVGDFIDAFKADNPGTRSEQDFRDNAKEIRILFQFTDTEITANAQQTLLDAEAFSAGNVRSFLFAAVELNGASYPRGRYASFTREINKRFNRVPAVVIFRADRHVTIAFVNRRPSRTQSDRQVLGSVSLIREIDTTNPHPAHPKILEDLALDTRLAWMQMRGKPANFDGLLDAWLDALDTEELNKRFYRELFRWFERAVNTARFPGRKAAALPAEEHVIRLITRLLFVWFVKEKGLVAEELFIENRVAELLKDYDRDAGDSYYRAVLQNLFFATLNTEMGQRRFSNHTHADHRNFSVYRYRNEIANPDELVGLFGKTPFINGGLFDCLDSFDAQGAGGVRIDCFTDNPKHRAGYAVPNRLFFGDNGLIDLFDRYKFTVEENTPAEREVALDPELLGKVFENLLAAYNPETRENARKQTGSYYTPRAVVDYMVDEALVATLAQKATSDDGDADFWQERLRYLLDYGDAFADAETLFTPAERENIVRVIANTKALDPAVGSGAYPMGILHKLTLALRRLDPNNELWEVLQKELARRRASAAFDTANSAERESELSEISRTFDKYRDSDFGRKLYLIQNSIYGVDVQPVATQIAKLRFFISLAIDQEPDPDAANYGIKPLPNLETRFVAADTLRGLERPAQLPLQTDTVRKLEAELAANRERHFHANTRRAKLACRRHDARLRERLAKALQGAGFPAASAAQIAAWEPFDQNADAAGWFDAAYMFGVNSGFDVVIGNPPYIQLQKDGGKMANQYKDAGFATFARTGDVYQLFYEKGCQLLKPQHGLLAYVTSNSWLKAEYGKGTRRYFAERHAPLQLLEMGKDVFENAIVDTSILLLREGNGGEANPVIPAVDMDRLDARDFPPEASRWGRARPDGEKPWSILSPLEQRVMDKMEAKGTPLKEWDVRINMGIKTGYNTAFVIDEATRQRLIAEDPNAANIIKPILRGRDIRRYRAQQVGQYLIDTHNGYASVPAINIDDYPAVKKHLGGFYRQLEHRQDKGQTPYNLRNCAYHEEFAQEKLFWMDLTEQGRFAYDDGETYAVNTVYMLTGRAIRYLCAILNASLTTWFMRNCAVTSGMGVTRWFIVSVATIPIPKIPAAKQRPFIRLVDRILAAKRADPTGDTADLEAEVDQLVYKLYGLTDEEIAAVEP